MAGPVLPGAVVQQFGAAETTWCGNHQQPSLALARAPEALWEFGFLLFLSNSPLGATNRLQTWTTVCQQSQKV